MLTPKIGKNRQDSLTGGPTQTDVKVLKRQFGLHHWIGLAEYIKIHIYNAQFGVWMK
jgi:hypothetical protein